MPTRNHRGIVMIRNITRTTVAMERFGNHVSAERNSRNNRKVPFSVRSVPRGYKKSNEDHLSQLSFGTPAWQDMSLETEELNWGIEASELFECSSVELKVGLWREDIMCAVKLKSYPCYRPWRPRRWRSHIFYTIDSLMVTGLSGLIAGRTLPPRKIPGTHFC
jgi:hypothetical protein